jgi:cellulose biosynthesis protein BcsQ
MHQIITSPSSAPTEIIAIVSQKGGVGKTTTAINLSIALVAAGRAVLLLDLDPHGYAGHTLVGGIHASGTERILRTGAVGIDTITATEIPDLFLAPASPGLAGIESELALLGDSRTRLHQALATLQMFPIHFDYVVIDCPPSVGLLTLNALAAAHRIIVPVTPESFVIEGLPILLKTINRLRAGLRQPLHSVQMLIAQRTQSTTTQALLGALRQDYGNLMLLTEIPYHNVVRDAAEHRRLLLAYCLSCDISQAYLDLAAEWLTLSDSSQDNRDETGRQIRARQERMSQLREIMSKRIQAWLMDPSSLLYDENWESKRHQDVQVLQAIFQDASPHRRARFLPVILPLLGLMVALLAWSHFQPPDSPWRKTSDPMFGMIEHAMIALDLTGAESKSPVAPLPAATTPQAGPPVAVTEKPTVLARPAEESVQPGAGHSSAGPEIQETTAADNTEASKEVGVIEESSIVAIVDTLATHPTARSVPAQESESTHPAGNTAASNPPAMRSGWREIAVPSPPQYRWQAQLLAGRSLDRVKEDSQKFLLEFSSQLQDLTLVIIQTRYGDARDEVYRLRVLDFPTSQAATAWCAEIRTRGRDCLVTRVSPVSR